MSTDSNNCRSCRQELLTQLHPRRLTWSPTLSSLPVLLAGARVPLSGPGGPGGGGPGGAGGGPGGDGPGGPGGAPAGAPWPGPHHPPCRPVGAPADAPFPGQPRGERACLRAIMGATMPAYTPAQGPGLHLCGLWSCRPRLQSFAKSGWKHPLTHRTLPPCPAFLQQCAGGAPFPGPGGNFPHPGDGSFPPAGAPLPSWGDLPPCDAESFQVCTTAQHGC